MLVDDHDGTRREMAELIQRHEGWRVVAEAASGEECLQVFERATPDLVVMDILLPMINGIEVTRKILARRPDSKVLVLSNYDGKTLQRSIRDAGARGYVSKDQAYEKLIPAILTVLAGGTCFDEVGRAA